MNAKIIKLTCIAFGDAPAVTRIFVCPYWDLLPPLSAEDREALKVSIQTHRLKTPIICVNNYEENEVLVIDGWHRLSIAEELGLASDDVPQEVIGDRDDYEPEQLDALAEELNLKRRHMSAEQRAEWVIKLRTKGKSIREIADQIGTSKSQVARDLATVPSGTVELPETIIGKDKRERPATMPPREPKGEASATPTQASLLISSPTESSTRVMGVFDQAEQRSEAKSAPSEAETQETPQKEADPILSETTSADPVVSVAGDTKPEEMSEVVFLCLLCGRRDFGGLGELSKHSDSEHHTNTQACELRCNFRLHWVMQGYYYPATFKSRFEIPHDDDLYIDGVRVDGPITLTGKPVTIETRRKQASLEYLDFNSGEPAKKKGEPTQAKQEAPTQSPSPKPQAKASEEGAASAAPSKKNGDSWQHWNTPPWLVAAVKKVGPVALDPCDNWGSFWDCRYGISEADDSLSEIYDWAGMAKGDLIVVNPPWGNMLPFVDRIITEVVRGAQVILIGPAGNPSSEWWQKAARNCVLRCDLSKRVAYYRDGKEETSPRDSTVLFYWGNQPGRFAAVFAPLGVISREVTVDMFAGAAEQIRAEELHAKQQGLPGMAAPEEKVQSEPEITLKETNEKPGPEKKEEEPKLLNKSGNPWCEVYGCYEPIVKGVYCGGHQPTPRLHESLKEIGASWQRKGYKVSVTTPKSEKSRSVMGTLGALIDRECVIGRDQRDEQDDAWMIDFSENTKEGKVVCTLRAFKEASKEETQEEAKQEEEFPSPWMTRGLKAINESLTREEVDKVAKPLIEKASTDEERAKLTEAYELTRARVPSAENVRFPHVNKVETIKLYDALRNITTRFGSPAYSFRFELRGKSPLTDITQVKSMAYDCDVLPLGEPLQLGETQSFAYAIYEPNDKEVPLCRVVAIFSMRKEDRRPTPKAGDKKAKRQAPKPSRVKETKTSFKKKAGGKR